MTIASGHLPLPAPKGTPGVLDWLEGIDAAMTKQLTEAMTDEEARSYEE
jgi:hypothetical protein